MAIYKMVGDKERLDKVAQTSFNEEGVLETSDLQRILRDQPEVLEEGLFIIAEEFSNWEDSSRRIDLLGLDSSGRLAVIELKRGETGKTMDLQAIRYAAMVSTITPQHAIKAHQAYLNKRGIEADAEERINDHLENPLSKGFTAERPRIVLVSEDFSKELTTCALWLNSSGLDVTCVRIQPYDSGGELLLETSQVIPLPEAQDYLIRVREREEEQAKTQLAGMGQFNQGDDIFKEQIASVQGQHRDRLNDLIDWAESLEKEKLAVLSTYQHGERCNLLVGLPIGNNPSLIRVIKEAGAIRFQPSYFKEYAPSSIPKLNESFDIDILGYSGSFNRKLENVGKGLLQALTQAYREANGLLETPSDQA